MCERKIEKAIMEVEEYLGGITDVNRYTLHENTETIVDVVQNFLREKHGLEDFEDIVPYLDVEQYAEDNICDGWYETSQGLLCRNL